MGDKGNIGMRLGQHTTRTLSMARHVTWPLQDIVLCEGVCTRINSNLCKQPLIWATLSPPLIAHTIA